jgi:hypothetical protein
MNREPDVATIDPILGELLAHVNNRPEQAWSSRSHGQRGWQIMACFEDRLGQAHLARPDPVPEEAGPGNTETVAAWNTCERELVRMGIPFTRVSTTGPRRLHLFFAVPG